MMIDKLNYFMFIDPHRIDVQKRIDLKNEAKAWRRKHTDINLRSILIIEKKQNVIWLDKYILYGRK